jgi:hypothetical protein
LAAYAAAETGGGGSVSRARQTSSRCRRRVDPALVLVLGCVVGLLVIFRAGLEVGATALVLAAAGSVGAVAGAMTRPQDHRHGLVLLAVFIAPMIVLGRWTAGPYGVIWLMASGAGAVAGRRSSSPTPRL